MCACACVGCVVVGLRYVRRRQTWKVEENGVLLHVFSVSFCISVILSLAYRHECVPSRDKGGYARTQRRVREEKKDLEQKRPPVSQNVAYHARVSCSSFVLVYSPRIRCSKQSQIIEGMTKYKGEAGCTALVSGLAHAVSDLPCHTISACWNQDKKKRQASDFHAPCKSCGVLKCRWALLIGTLLGHIGFGNAGSQKENARNYETAVHRGSPFDLSSIEARQ